MCSLLGPAAVPIEGLYKDELSLEQKVQIQRLLKDGIPTGFNQHRKRLETTSSVLEKMTETLNPTEFVKGQLLLPRVQNQLGTLALGTSNTTFSRRISTYLLQAQKAYRRKTDGCIWH